MQNSMRFFCGSSHPELGKEIAKELNIDLGKIYLSKFSCGENYARIEETIRGYDIYLLQGITENPNDDLMELFVIMDALKRSSAKSINVVLPYFAYSRQDKKSAPREPISSRLIADLLNSIGFNRLICMDLHADQIQGFFNSPVDHLISLPLFVKYFSEKNIPDLVVVAPDTGRAKLAKKLADKLNANLAVIHKTRPDHNVAEVVNIIGNVEKKTVLIIDDMIDTAGSVTSSIKALKSFGCNENIYLAATHAVFSGPAIERLKNANFKEVVITNSVPLPENKKFPGLTTLSIGPLFAEVIKRNHEKESISSLFI